MKKVDNQQFQVLQCYRLVKVTETEKTRRAWPYGWYGRSRCRQGKGGETAGRCVQPHLRLRRAKPTGEGQWQGQGHRLRHGHELRADGRTAHQGAAHRFGVGCGQLRAGL